MNLQGPQSHSAAGCGNPQPWWPPICVCSYIQYKLGIQSQFLSFNFSVVLWFLASQGFCDSSLAYGSNPHIVCCPSGSTLVQLWQNEIQRQELCSPKVPAPLINHCKYHTVLKSVVVRQVAFSEGGQPKRSTYFPQWRFSSKVISPQYYSLRFGWPSGTWSNRWLLKIVWCSRAGLSNLLTFLGHIGRGGIVLGQT